MIEKDNKLEQESDFNEKSDTNSISESKAEVKDSVVSSSEEKEEVSCDNKESSCEEVVVEEVVDEEVVDEEDSNKTTLTEEKSTESILDDNSEENESSKEQTVEQINNLPENQHSISSSKPQVVLDELDKLKTVQNESVTAKDTSVEEKEPDKTEEPIKVDEVDKTDELDKIDEVDKVEELQLLEQTKEAPIAVAPAPAPVSNSEEFSFKQVFNKDFFKSFIFDVFFLIFCAWFTFMLIQKWFSTREVIIQGTSQVHGSIESGEKTSIGNINILVLGIDSVEGTHRSDTIFVLGVNPSKNKMMMLSIPRDTKVDIEGRSRKINEILPRYGEPVLRSLLEDLLKIRISRKIEIGFESFVSVVDAIGGVDINIEKPMHYDDNWGNLHIHFDPGLNHLDGQDALRYVRFRKDAMADLGRIKRQQDFVKAVVKKLFSPTTIVRVPSIIEKAFNHTKTDFTLQEVLTLAKGFDSFNVKFSTMSLPGEARYIEKISFFIPNLEEVIAIGNNYFSDLAILEIEKDCDFGKVIPKQVKSNRKSK